MKEPLVSVIVPIYKTEKYLKKCVDSILNQSYKNLEVILVDDGSPDNCGKMIDEYAKKDKRVIAIHQKNGGQSRARNVGIERARGEFISFVDSDDEIQGEFISELVKTLQSGKDLAVIGMYYRWLKSGKEYGAHIKKLRAQRKNESIEHYMAFLLTVDGRMYSSLNKLYRAKIIGENNLRFTEDLKFAEDTQFVLRYLKKAKNGIGFVLKPLYIYNYGTENSTIKKTGTIWRNWLRSYEDVKEFVGKPRSLSTTFWMKMVLLRWRVAHYRSCRRAKN